MSADIIDMPGAALPDRPITEQEVDRLHSKNFRDLEGRINNCAIMASIALEMAMPLIFGIEPKHEKAQFAICKAAQMLKQLQADYQAGLVRRDRSRQRVSPPDNHTGRQRSHVRRPGLIHQRHVSNERGRQLRRP
jgi:hypothetical protein